MPNNILPVFYVDTVSQLEIFIAEALKSDIVGVDTEFMWEKTYYPQACLIQVACQSQIACIDPLAIDDLSALDSLMSHPEITKIFHAGGQDMVLFQSLLGSLPNSVFDTQIAASFLGMGEQIAYARLIESMFSVKLDKSQSRTNWAKRPLTEAQIQYAADDVRYLSDARCELLEQFKHQNQRKLSWLDEDNNTLINPDKYKISNEQLLSNVRGSTTLTSSELSIALRLAMWREQRAIQKNRPRRWILADPLIMEMAKQQPATLQQLKQLDEIRTTQLKMGESLLEVIADESNTGSLPSNIVVGPLSNEQQSLVKIIRREISHAAEQQSINPTTIGSRRIVESLIRGNTDSPLLKGWRYELVGEDIEKIISEIP